MRTLALLWIALAACEDAGGVDADDDGVVARDDCDDADPAVFPGADEVCNGVDDDCDGAVDADDAGVVGVPIYYRDGDGDGVGAASLGPACTPPAGAVARGGDCDDAQADVNPSAVEVCDGVDNDCDSRVDDADDGLDDPDAPRWFHDKDLDGYGSSSDTVLACVSPGPEWSSVGEDCDDADDERNPGADEICDGKDNNCDVATGLLVDEADPAFVGGGGGPTWYADGDRDGFGAGPIVADCDGGPGLADRLGDCDDARSDVHPGVTERCDRIDNDCDGYTDDDQWWDDTYGYRIPVTVRGPARVTRAPAVAVQVSPRTALTAFSDPGTPVPSSYRLVLQDCARGYPQVPFDLVDAAVGLLDPGVAPVAGAPFEGSLVFRYDLDGVWATKENLSASGTEQYALYFSSTTLGTSSGSVPQGGSFSYTAGATTVLQNDLTRLELDPAEGGLATWLGRIGGQNVGAQAESTAGNGLYLGPRTGGLGEWVQATDATGTITQVFVGDVAAVLRSTGSATGTHGTFAYTVTWLMVASRPEVYAKVAYTASGPTRVGPQSPTWTTGVRPWQVDNEALLGLGTTTGFRDPAYRFVRATYANDTFGVALGWRDMPLAAGNPVQQADGRFLGLVGQDFEESPTSTTIDVGWGDALLDHAVTVAIPFTGSWSASEVDVLGTIAGTRGEAGAPQIVPVR